MRLSRKKVAALAFLPLLLIGMSAYLAVQFLPTTFEINEISIPSEISKGDSLIVRVKLTVKGTPIVFSKAIIQVERKQDSKSVSYKSPLNQELTIGTHTIKVTLPPIIADNRTVLPLAVGTFEITGISIEGKPNTKPAILKQKNLNLGFNVKKAQIEERIKEHDFRTNTTLGAWEVINPKNLEYKINSSRGLVITNPTHEPISFKLRKWVNLTGIPAIQVNYTGKVEAIIIKTNDTALYPLSQEADFESFVAMDRLGRQRLEIDITVSANSEVAIQHIRAPTKHRAIFLAVMSHFWNSGPGYADLLEDIREASIRFEQALNVSYIPSPPRYFEYPPTTDLATIRDYAVSASEKAFGIPGGWRAETGYSAENKGFDVLFIATNETADHYGIVFAQGGEPTNYLVIAAQSKEAYGVRVQAEWVDNLFQHELSHVLWALDRWSNSDPPSVMTKPSSVSDALQMLNSETLWLQITNWLVEDQIRMYTYRDRFES